MSGMKALLRSLFEAMTNDTLQRRRQVSVRPDEVRRIISQDRMHRLGSRVALKGAAPRKHLVQDSPEREDV